MSWVNTDDGINQMQYNGSPIIDALYSDSQGVYREVELQWESTKVLKSNSIEGSD